MNLAGRKAGFFTAVQGSADGLKAAFEPAELSVTGHDLLADQADGTSAWAKALIAAR